jgi:hypothetical protein
MRLMVKYDLENCNINGCKNKHKDLFLCQFHFNIYLSDNKLKEKLNRLFRIVNNQATVKDKLIYYKFYFFHYLTGIHVPYIEHFPLETIFEHYKKKLYKENNYPFTIEQFASNFDYQENKYLDDIKVHFETKSFYEPIKLFVDNKDENKPTIIYFSLILIAFLITLISEFYGINLPHITPLKTMLICVFIGVGIVHTGIFFSNQSKTIINETIENKLFKESDDNKLFLKKSHRDIQRIRTMEENLWNIKGVMFASILFFIYKTVKENIIYDNISIILFTIITLTLGYCINILFSVIWENRYVITIIRHFNNFNFNIQLYNKNKNLGINNLKKFINAITLYNSFVIISLIIVLFITKIRNNQIPMPIKLIIWLFTIRNFTSIRFINPLIKSLKKQFIEVKQSELEALSSKSSASSITKYDFIDNLRLNIFINPRIIKEVLLYLTPILLSVIFLLFDDQIKSFFKNLYKIII